MAYKDIFSDKIKTLLASDEWLIVEDNYTRENNLAYESLFCLSSGTMGNRASHEEGFSLKTLPANYIHGVFDKSESFQRELCNTPDWTKLKMYYNCDPISLETGKKVSEYIRILDMKNGIVAKHYILTSHDGRKTQVEIYKILSRHTPHCGAIKYNITPLNYHGILEFENIIDATVTNFIDFPRFRVKHLHTREVSEITDFGAYIQSETRDFNLPIGTMTAVKILDTEGNNILKSRKFKAFGEVACEFLDTKAEKGKTIIIEKYAAITSGNQFKNVKASAKTALTKIYTTGFDTELTHHIAEYTAMWDIADLKITGDKNLQKAIRFNIFHLMSTPNPHSNTTNIGAKLIHGEEYGGHAFWDTELFIRPFFDFTFPHIAKNLVEYRYILLEKAKENAKKNGYDGAQYPWESADTGDEECPAWTIEPDGSCYRCHVADYEHHVTAAIAYGAMKYYTVTDDQDYFDTKGLEIFTETAKFWISRITQNTKNGHYEIQKVTGPDEWHEPVNNNTYTNYLAKWNIIKAIDIIHTYKTKKPTIYTKLMKKVGITDKDLQTWQTKADAIYLPKTDGLIEQFDGYFTLTDTIITKWDTNGMPLLSKKQKTIPKEKRNILKQADIIMLLFLMEDDFSPETQKINFEYYEKRTLHRSSLSPSIHGIMSLRIGDTEGAYKYLERSAYVDIANNQGNTREGLHAASCGGTWQCITLGYCGMSIDTNGIVTFKPKLPHQWTKVQYSIIWKGTTLRITIEHNTVTIHADKKIPYTVHGEKKTTIVEQL